MQAMMLFFLKNKHSLPVSSVTNRLPLDYHFHFHGTFFLASNWPSTIRSLTLTLSISHGIFQGLISYFTFRIKKNRRIFAHSQNF